MKFSKLLIHPIFLLALFTLIVNDFILKWEYHNWLTGKLSDFAGLIVAPIFLSILFPKIKANSVFVLGLFFIFWKSPFSQNMIDFVNQLSSFQFHRVVDYSDLIALPILSVPYFLLQKNKSISFIHFKKFNPSLLIFLLTCFALFSTSRMTREIPNGDIYINTSFKVNKSKEEVLEKIEAKGYSIKRDSTPTLKRSYLYIENFAVDDKSFAKITFNVSNSANAKRTRIMIINITFKEEYQEQHWRDMKRDTRYYKGIIKHKLKKIILEK